MFSKIIQLPITWLKRSTERMSEGKNLAGLSLWLWLPRRPGGEWLLVLVQVLPVVEVWVGVHQGLHWLLPNTAENILSVMSRYICEGVYSITKLEKTFGNMQVAKYPRKMANCCVSAAKHKESSVLWRDNGLTNLRGCRAILLASYGWGKRRTDAKVSCS
jgi:hypothetical protein